MERSGVLAAVVLVVLMVHAWGDSASVSPLVSCEPSCACMNTGDKVVNPRNCSEFYYCNGVTPYGPVPCGAGTHFDVTEQECVPGGDCDHVCGPGPNCQLTCTETLSVVGDALNCSAYYICTPDRPVPQGCPKDRPNFDKDTQLCVDDESVCCTGYCEAYCDGSGFSLVPDPSDCTRFFICDTKVGKPEEDHHFRCDGGYFNVQRGDCVRGNPPDPCRTLCSAAGGGSSTTITTTSSSSTTSTTTTPGGGGSTDINGCVSSLACIAKGYFPACSTCQPEYFQCSGAGSLGVLRSCTDSTVFNPTTGYPYCILPSNCPYP